MKDKIQFADLPGVRIAYYDMQPDGGSDRSVLLIHGFASNARVNWIGTNWAKRLVGEGYRVIALDNRGHGESSKFYEPEDYGPDIFANDALALMDHLKVGLFDVIGFSMGARIASWLAHAAPERVKRAVFGGMGSHIFGGRGGYETIALGLEADDPATITDPAAQSFRHFADRTGSDRLALAACVRPSKLKITEELIASIKTPVLVAVGTEDAIGGSAEELAAMMQNALAFPMPGLDHMRSTGAEPFKQKAIEFLAGEGE